MHIIKMFAFSLAATLLVELVIGYLFGVRKAKGIFLLALVNILTNPVAVCCAWCIRLYYPGCNDFIMQVCIEVLVVIAEAAIYYVFSREEKYSIRHPVLLSIFSNTISWGLFYIIG